MVSVIGMVLAGRLVKRSVLNPAVLDIDRLEIVIAVGKLRRSGRRW